MGYVKRNRWLLSEAAPLSFSKGVKDGNHVSKQYLPLLRFLRQHQESLRWLLYSSRNSQFYTPHRTENNGIAAR